jgi:hypothetical protein
MAKCIINSTLSTPKAKCLHLDIKDFYLNTEMEHYEYMQLPISLIHTKIIEQYIFYR